jgi:hypothetical protein
MKRTVNLKQIIHNGSGCSHKGAVYFYDQMVQEGKKTPSRPIHLMLVGAEQAASAFELYFFIK